MKKEVIEFAMYLTGHDKETILQMYNDWKKPYINCNNCNYNEECKNKTK